MASTLLGERQCLQFQAVFSEEMSSKDGETGAVFGTRYARFVIAGSD